MNIRNATYSNDRTKPDVEETKLSSNNAINNKTAHDRPAIFIEESENQDQNIRLIKSNEKHF